MPRITMKLKIIRQLSEKIKIIEFPFPLLSMSTPRSIFPSSRQSPHALLDKRTFAKKEAVYTTVMVYAITI